MRYTLSGEPSPVTQGKNRMEEKSTKHRPHAQKKYRRSQSNKGLVRFELQVSADAKERFDALVNAAAEEYAQPWDPPPSHRESPRTGF